MSNYLEMHNNCGLKVGDEVTVTRAARNYEQGWKNTWESGMDVFIGEVGVISKDRGNAGFIVNFGNGHRSYMYPCFVLEKVERKPEFNEKIKVSNDTGWNERHVVTTLPNGEAVCFVNKLAYPTTIHVATWKKWRFIDDNKPAADDDNEWAKYTF